MQNEKPVATNNGSNIRTDNQTITMTNHNPNTIKFQYSCSFCACELPDDGARFNGVGACSACDELAHLWVDSLREHAANYSNNLGVRK
jgi:hypothetical protein